MVFELSVNQMLGLAGFLMLFASFLLNHTKKFKRYTLQYNGLNLIGAGVLAWYSLQINDAVFLIVNSVWAIVALYFVVRRLLNKDVTHELSDFDVREPGLGR